MLRVCVAVFPSAATPARSLPALDAICAADYHELHTWSVENVSAFWKAAWEYTDILHSAEFAEVVEDKPMDQIPKWFKGARLNYAENALRWNDDRVALVCIIRILVSRRVLRKRACCGL